MAQKSVFQFSKPIKPQELEAACAQGMIRMQDLEDGSYYRGKSRRASVAMWSAKETCFIYMRQKFTVRFASRISHPENDEGFDFFVPLEKVTPTEKEIVKESA